MGAFLDFNAALPYLLVRLQLVLRNNGDIKINLMPIFCSDSDFWRILRVIYKC
jgi:hypothetical protein